MAGKNGSADIGKEAATSPPPQGAPFNEVEDVIYRRRSVRAYKKKQVPEYLIRRILEAGRFAPSAGNAQTWKFIVIRDPEILEEMTNDVVETCGRILKILDYTRPEKKLAEPVAKLLQRIMPNSLHPIPFAAIKEIGEGRLGLFHGAPTVIIMLYDRRSPGKPLVDIGIAGQNMVLTAHSYGLGTCWVGFIELLARSHKWKKRLGIKYPYKLAESIVIGYPRGTPDGYVTRETKAIDWYDENGVFSVKY